MDKPAPISGYRSRAINAVADFAAAVRPVAGPGILIADGPGGKVVSADGAGRRATPLPLPWTVRAVPVPGATDPAAVEWRVRVWAGPATLDGQALSPPTPGGADNATGLPWHDAPAAVSGSPYLCVCNAGSGSWALGWKGAESDPAPGAEYRAIARLLAAGPPPRLAQLDLGVVDLGEGGSGGAGFGPDDPPGDYVVVQLGGSGATASQDTWNFGDTDPATGKPTAPQFRPFRLYWDDTGHQLLAFSRVSEYNHCGALVSVAAEVAETVFTAVAEMP